jgi:hypothetical protein
MNLSGERVSGHTAPASKSSSRGLVITKEAHGSAADDVLVLRRMLLGRSCLLVILMPIPTVGVGNTSRNDMSILKIRLRSTIWQF